MKSEPDVFSIDDLESKNIAGWDGVRNYQARNYLRAMRSGDLAFFYHSNARPPAIAGVMKIVRESYPDPTQFDRHHHQFDRKSTLEKPRWDQVDVQFVERSANPMPLDEIKRIPALKKMMLLHRSRLSVQPVTEREWQIIRQRIG